MGRNVQWPLSRGLSLMAAQSVIKMGNDKLATQSLHEDELKEIIWHQNT